jgi:site-specific DNA recombinase
MANNKATRKAAKKAVGSIRRAVLYARVSTDEQANGYSLETQLAACRKYAVQHSLVIVGEFQDDFTGTVPIEMRPEGKKAFTMLKQDEADVLVCYTIDRLVRPPEDGDEWDLPILIRGLAKLNKELHTVDRGKRDTSFAGLLIAMLDAKSAGDERRKIIERTARGRNAKAQNGIPPCTGFAPYGYRYTKSDASLKANDNVIIFEPEAQVVRLIYKWYTQGDESGKRLNINAIGKKLTAMGIATPTARTRPRTRADGVWEYSTLNYILTNEIYAGVLRFGKERPVWQVWRSPGRGANPGGGTGDH